MIINLVNFNLWADPFLQQERLNWFINTILKSTPDIVYLQGVTKETIIPLSKALQERKYTFVTNTQERLSFEVLATRWKIGDWKFNKFSTSKRKAGLLWGYIEINDKKLGLATSELDVDTSNVGQVNCSLGFLSEKFDNCIVGMDTHLKQSEFPIAKWQDAWVTTGANPFCKFTLDYKRNNNLYEKVQLRSSRLFYKGELKPIAFNLFGTEKVCGQTKKMNPSAHFGLQFSFIF